MTVTSMSEAEFLKEKNAVGKITSRLADSKKMYGLWADRYNRQFQATQYAESQNYYQRLNEINAISNNPTNVQRWEKEAQDEKKRLMKIQEDKERKEKYIIDYEEKRLQVALDLKLKEDEKIRLEQEELIWKQLEFLKNNSNELESFYDFDKTVKEIDDDIQTIDSNEGIESIESIETIEGIEGVNGMQKQIPLEKITPVMLLLGAGIVFYLFGSGRFDKK